MLPAIKYSCLRVGGAGKEERSACVSVWENGEEDFKKKDVGLSLCTRKLISTSCVPTTSLALTGGQRSSRSKQGVFDVVLLSKDQQTQSKSEGDGNTKQQNKRTCKYLPLSAPSLGIPILTARSACAFCSSPHTLPTHATI